MKTFIASFFILAVVMIPLTSYGEDCEKHLKEGEVNSPNWQELKRADGQVVGFEGKAWFCQAKTFTGKTECYYGAKPPRPGCYVLLNPCRTAWIAVDDAAAQLGSDSRSPSGEKHLSSASGFGCGVPDSHAYWLLWKIK